MGDSLATISVRADTRPSLRAAALAALAGCLLLGGCGSSTVPPRDFNELIPRMMSAINNQNPDKAAANLFNVTSADERRDAVAYLETKKYGHDLPYMRAYELLTTDPSPMVRGQAMRALGSSHQAAAGPYLVKGLSDAAAEVRRDAAVGLQTTFGPAATDPLAQLAVSDPDDQVRIQSVRALQNSPTAPSVRALIAALDDRNAAVVYWAHLSLVRITRQEIGFDPKQWLTWYQQRYALPGTRPASAAPEKAAPPDFAPAPGAPSHAG